jgi:aspartyl/asparaginyl-tRNA synthetase
MHPSIDLIDPKEYDSAVTKMREFFRSKGFLETPIQHRLSILAACEDPTTIGTYNYAGQVWPLPQTGQMWLEYEILTKPREKGFYCITTSFRNEPNPIPGRHNLIFPMFEFETHGGQEELQKLETELLEFMGFGAATSFKELEYEDAKKKYGVDEIKAKEEAAMQNDYGSVVLLKNFPQYTSPFWNMKKDGEHAKKIDVILYGIETIGSAERSTNPDEMRDLFYNISGGMYANTLFAQFTKERVEKELNAFLKHNFIPRCGGGIGVTRMIRAMKMAGLQQ